MNLNILCSFQRVVLKSLQMQDSLLQEEKEIVLIVIPSAIKDKMLHALYKEVGILLIDLYIL